MASEPKPRAAPPGTLIFKTREDARVSDTKPAVARKHDPVCDDDDGADISAAAAAYATAKTPEASPYPWWDWVSRNLEYRQNFMRDVIGQVIASERRDTRAALAQEVGAIKRELTVLLHEQITECARALREETREETKAAREQLERDDASMRRELELSKRELTVLREEVALERGLRDLRAEVEEARKAAPKFPAIARDLEAETARLRKELAAVKDRHTRLRADWSQTDYAVGELRKKTEAARAASIEVEFASSSTHFQMKASHPDAARALKEFAREIVNGKADGTIWLPGSAGSA
jgi:hypothetical protein